MPDNSSLLLATKNLYKSYVSDEGLLSILSGGKRIPALNGVSLEIQEGEILGLTGESGSGKSALGRIIAGLDKPDRGVVMFMGKPLSGQSEAEVKKARRYLRFISEENFSGLNQVAKNRLDNLLYEMVDRYSGAGGKAEAHALADELVDKFGIPQEFLSRYPNQISGGQRQRYAIARAFATQPRLVVADEPVSNLDLNSRTEILDKMLAVGRRFGTAFLFISHNLSMVRYFAAKGRTAIMFGGRIMEIVPTARLFEFSAHPYTRNLLEINPSPSPLPGAALDPAQALAEYEHYQENDPALATLESEASNLSFQGNFAAAAQLTAASQPGCVFYRWCTERVEECGKVSPTLSPVAFKRGDKSTPIPLSEAEANPHHLVACLHYGKE
ncbi:MAG: ABC transporter ATP-binding protein [Chloroflexi bacterium]|uniref:ABC transporter ATP-binding protein n=1 Tax=Candidatus Chlorohelix allophototropha TaxID=3003348 RepID=A0A8T7LVB8_9CHLR|nr:ABC transporter ATP-binding protein [Chloroflexota bacterium]WJW67835.1 ABC transporter ATP-binding protein [Chloroflexota bacterium L227-S17]